MIFQRSTNRPITMAKRFGMGSRQPSPAGDLTGSRDTVPAEGSPLQSRRTLASSAGVGCSGVSPAGYKAAKAVLARAVPPLYWHHFGQTSTVALEQPAPQLVLALPDSPYATNLKWERVRSQLAALTSNCGICGGWQLPRLRDRCFVTTGGCQNGHLSGQLRLWFTASTTATAKYEEDCPADSAHGSHVKEVDSANVSWESVFAQKVAAAAHVRLRPSRGSEAD